VFIDATFGARSIEVKRGSAQGSATGLTATRTRQRGRVCPDNANIRGSVLARATMRATKDAWQRPKKKRRRDVNEGGLIWRGKLDVGNNAHIAARSLTPKERLTSWTIILSLPPSAVSSGTSIAAACTSASSGSIAGSTSWVA
jgi:hypothetical protein